MAFTSDCGKCNGKGNLACFSSIAGGVCFSCNGTGKVITKSKPQPGIKFEVSAIEKATSERIAICVIKARTSAAALKMATVQLSRGNDYLPESAEVRAA